MPFASKYPHTAPFCDTDKSVALTPSGSGLSVKIMEFKVPLAAQSSFTALLNKGPGSSSDLGRSKITAFLPFP